MRGVILDAGSLGQDSDLTPLLGELDDWEIYDWTQACDISRRCSRADVIFTNKVQLHAAQLAELSSLRLICVMATGVNNIDLKAAASLGIEVSNVRGYATDSVVQHTICLLLNLATRMPDYIQAVARGDWQKAKVFCLLEPRITEVAGKKLGIVGWGNLGRRVAGVAEALGMQVLVSERPGRERVSTGRLAFPQILAESDFLSLHCPLTRQNQHLICDETLSLMRPGACLINTARGGLVDSAALLGALDSGQLGGAAIDVLVQEPPSAAELLLDQRDNLIVTPHSAWASAEARQRLIGELAANVRAFREGAPRNQVTEGAA